MGLLQGLIISILYSQILKTDWYLQIGKSGPFHAMTDSRALSTYLFSKEARARRM